MQHARRRRPAAEPAGQLAAQPLQGGDPLGEHHGPGRRCPGRRRSREVARPARRSLAGAAGRPPPRRACRGGSSASPSGVLQLAPSCARVLSRASTRLDAARPVRRGRPWPASTGTAAVAAPVIGARATCRVQPDRPTARRRPRPRRRSPRRRERPGSGTLGPVGARPRGATSGLMPVAADEQVRDVLAGVVGPGRRSPSGRAAGSARRTTPSSRCAGWREARISASVFGASRRASSLLLGAPVGEVVRLVDDHGVPVGGVAGGPGSGPYLSVSIEMITRL